MNTYKFIFTIKQAIYPLTETVQAETVEAAKTIVSQMVVDAGLTSSRSSELFSSSIPRMNSPSDPPDDEPGFDDQQDGESVLLGFTKRKDERLALFATLEERIGIPKGFIDQTLIEKNDWAFIIKLAVLCEAAVTHALTIAVGNDKTAEHLEEHFSEVQNSRRLQLALKLGILNKADMQSLDAIAQVRNSFAHRVENLNGSLETFFENCKPDKKVDLITKLLQREGKEKPKATDDFQGFTRIFRMMIAVAAVNPLRSIAYYGLAADKRAEQEKLWPLNNLFMGDAALGFSTKGGNPNGGLLSGLTLGNAKTLGDPD